MMHSSRPTDFPGLLHQLVVFSEDQPAPDVEPAAAPCATTGKLLQLFESITGWQVAFEESRDSLLCRAGADQTECPMPRGSMKIVDMSADWPAQTPTGHRGKCDQFVRLLDELVGQRHAAEVELLKAKSALAAFDPAISASSKHLIDSFVPQFGRRKADQALRTSGNPTVGKAPNDLVCDSQTVFGDPAEHFQTKQPHAGEAGRCSDGGLLASEVDFDFEVTQSTSPGARHLSVPFAGWSLGGATGVNDSVYVDWYIDRDDLVAISVGRIESDFGDGDAEAIIECNPETEEFRVLGCPSLGGLFVWDPRADKLEPLAASSQWKSLRPGQALVAATHFAAHSAESLATREADRGADLVAKVAAWAKAPAEELAGCIARHFCPEEKFLVLKRVWQ